MAWSTREIAELAGTSLRAVRHHHEVGLLDEPERRANGYKQYGVAHLVRLVRIKRVRPPIGELSESMVITMRTGRSSAVTASIAHVTSADSGPLVGRSVTGDVARRSFWSSAGLFAELTGVLPRSRAIRRARRRRGPGSYADGRGHNGDSSGWSSSTRRWARAIASPRSIPSAWSVTVLTVSSASHSSAAAAAESPE